jgi:hypothetical protein
VDTTRQLDYRAKVKSELEILEDVSGKLNSAGIPFMLTGSVAMSYYAQPRMTRDIGIVVALALEKAGEIERLFGAAYYLAPEAVSEAIQRQSMFNIVHLDSVIKVDFIVLPNTPFALEEFRRRRDIVIGDFQTTIISREDLILWKLVWAQVSSLVVGYRYFSCALCKRTRCAR